MNETVPDRQTQSAFSLEMRDISKDFPGVRALDQVSLQVHPGEIHGLVGENGAGKSTLMKILAGAMEMDSGEIVIDGERVEIHAPQDALARGIAIIYQEFNLVPYLTVYENIFLGREESKLGFLPARKEIAEAQRLLSQLGISLDVTRTVQELSVAEQQMVEIAKALSLRAKIIAMDEPSATLTLRELNNLFQLMRVLQASGVSLIYISHRLEEVFQITDNITVLRDGNCIGTVPTSSVDRTTLIRMMVGRELTEEFPKRAFETGESILSVKDLCPPGGNKSISFQLQKGEILAITGLVGAGRTELVRALFGADPALSGEIVLEGRPVHIASPRQAISRGICLLTEDRKAEGLVLGMSVRENISLPILGDLTRFGFIHGTRERKLAERSIGSLRIKTPSMEQEVQNLSGGNQQKVVLAKWLLTQSKVVIFDEPTRGIDVGAKTEIYHLMNDLVEKGIGVVMISSELPEVLGMSDRVLVMHGGEIKAEFNTSETTQEEIMHHATGQSGAFQSADSKA